MTPAYRLQAALAVCIFLFIGLGFAFMRPGITDFPPHVSFSPDRDGAKALRTLLEREGARVVEWRLPPGQLPKGSDELYIAIEPDALLGKSSRTELEQWATDNGNHVVIFDSFPGGSGYWEAEMEGTDDAKSGEITASGPGGEHMYEAAVSSDFRYIHVAEKEVLLGDGLGVIAARRAAGEGSVTEAVTPEWTHNANILEGSRFELVWSMLGGSPEGRTVYMDEYYHGYGVSPGLSQVFPPWLLAGFGQLAAAIAIWLWWKGKRLGPAITPREFRVRRSDETLLAAAGWYRRGKLTRESLGYRVENLKRTLAARGAGVAPDAGAGEIAAAARRLLAAEPAKAEALAEVLRRWSEPGEAAYTESQWLKDSAVLDEALRGIEEA